VDLVPKSAVAEDRLSRPSFDYKAALLIGADRARVELEDRQRDPVQSQVS